MKLLLDTHLLLWASEDSPRLPALASRLIADSQNELLFSVASIWEISIKHAKGLESFHARPGTVWEGLLENGYAELAVRGKHAVAAGSLPPIHKDPFDRILIGQAMVEGITLLTADPVIAKYPGPIRKV
ncbi:MAG: type II toxin-antitoxin system VapC family toxin [Terracidiphilus sp.]|jgi:PIN domain nuclease of toxin-antitoxin system